ncbi:MAG: glycosyltransferase, partial [Thermoplasmata archaeon]
MRYHRFDQAAVNRNGSKSTFASVIVICHDRRQYLRQAVESIIAQDVDRNRFEIIVVKNYKDEFIDAYLAGACVQSVLCDAKPATQKAAEGFRTSKGDVLLFLDDDDLFEPGRLKVVLSSFDDNPQLGFYRNEVTFIGADGSSLSRSLVRSFGIHAPTGSPRLYIEGDERYSVGLKLAKASPEFNPSSMAIRRELFARGLPYLLRMTTTLDTILWFEALVSDASILLDNRPFTRYRIHDSNSSLARGNS